MTKNTKDKYKPLRLVVCIVILILAVVCGEICVNKFFNENYSSLADEEKTLIHELARIKEITVSNGRMIFSDLYSPAEEPFLLVETFDQTKIVKKIFAFNLPGVDNMWYSKKLTGKYKEEAFGNIYTLSRFSPGGAPLLFASDTGEVTIEGKKVRYFTYTGGVYTGSSYSLDYFFNSYAYDSFIAFCQQGWEEAKYVKSENTQEYYTLLSLEYNILDKLIPYSDEEELRSLLFDFATVRNLREQKFPSVSYCESVELTRGCANFVAMKLSLWRKRGYCLLSDITGDSEGTFSLVLSSSAKGKFPVKTLETKMYSQSGALLVTALERIDMGYKKELLLASGKKTPFDLVEEYLASSCKGKERLSLEELIEKYGVDEESVKLLSK